jgi:uncharacterized protein YutE (UPF0331/DUF86 family)
MNGKVLLLIQNIRRDMDAIADIYDRLEQYTLTDETEEDVLIVMAYHLHNLYNAFENIFQNVAAVFEHDVADTERWHARLLEHMRLDIMPLRPAVIDDEAYKALDELRRFRHLFRHAYAIDLDPQRLALVLRKALELKTVYRDQLEAFVAFLQALSESGRHQPPDGLS